MKMFGHNSLSLYLFHITRLLFWGTTILILFIGVSLLTENHKIENEVFNIAIPFTATYIKGAFEWNTIATIFISLSFYGVLFFLLSNIFKTFKAPILFTKTAIRLLNYFAILNLIIVPAFYILIALVIMNQLIYDILPTFFLHVLLGIFALFIIAVFKQGYKVQQENDLTI